MGKVQLGRKQIPLNMFIKPGLPGPVDSIGAPKMFILGKRMLGTQILTQIFFCD